MIDLLPLIGGLITGTLLWWFLFRPLQLRDHERRRRAAGLRAERELPEDRR